MFISEGVAMWQRHWQAKRNILMHKHLRHVEYFANPEKVGKELDADSSSNCPLSNRGNEKVSNCTEGAEV